MNSTAGNFLSQICSLLFLPLFPPQLTPSPPPPPLLFFLSGFSVSALPPLTQLFPPSCPPRPPPLLPPCTCIHSGYRPPSDLCHLTTAGRSSRTNVPHSCAQPPLGSDVSHFPSLSLSLSLSPKILHFSSSLPLTTGSYHFSFLSLPLSVLQLALLVLAMASILLLLGWRRDLSLLWPTYHAGEASFSPPLPPPPPSPSPLHVYLSIIVPCSVCGL